MTIISQNKRYLPHEITTTVNSVKLYRQTKDISFVCRRYHISKASLMRWNKQYDGTKESLPNKSHRPHSPHPNAHIEQELPSPKSQQQHLRIVRQAAGGKSVQPSSRLPVPSLCQARIPPEGGIDQEEIETPGPL